MAKIGSLTSVVSGYLGTTAINANFSAIETAFANTVSRDGSSPNTMTADLDMNSNQLLNLATPTSNTHAATKKYVDDNTSAAGIAAAAASAASAASSASSASASATSASNSASAAATSETNAGTSETNAAASAAAAAQSAAEGMYSQVIDKDFSDSPFVPALAEEGTLYKIDTSGGNVVVNLSELSTYGEDMKFAFVKSTGDANTITINRGGSDTIDAGTSTTINDQFVVTVLVGDLDGSQWFQAIQSANVADDSITLAKLASGTAGNLITYDSNGDPAAVATGSSGQVLTSNGAGSAPTFQAGPVFTESYESAEQTITSAGSLTLAHGLSGAPKIIQCLLVCKTAEHNYSVDDQLFINIGDSTAVGSGYSLLSVVPDGTNLNVRYGAYSSAFIISDKSTGNSVAATNANWRLIIRAYY